MTERLLDQHRRDALHHGGVLPAMWLQPGFVVRIGGWLGDRWGGGAALTIESTEFDPARSYLDSSLGVSRGYIRLNGFFDVAQHDLIELLRPQIATPVQWRWRMR